MKNEVLIVPDIHGRDFWKGPCEEWDGTIIFLGDYVDPYYPTTQLESFNNLKDLIEFSKNTKCTCKFLLGNHDFSYLVNKDKCRFDYARAEEIKELLQELQLVVCTYIKTPKVIYLFSHAGFTNDWLKGTDYTDLSFVVPKGYRNIVEILRAIPYSRGGLSIHGSCIWNSLLDFISEDHFRDCLENVYQIFGHTQMNKEVIKSDFACLDCRKCFILDLDSKEIREY